MFSVYFETYGCQMNVADSQMLSDWLAQYGYATTDSAAEADLIVINTCSVRERAEIRAKRKVREFAALKRKNKPDQQIWLIGCLAQREGERLKEEIPGIDRVIGATEVEHLHEHIASYLQQREQGSSFVRTSSAVSAFVPVMRGCDNFCTYCIVPYVRGREHSVPAEEVEHTIRQLVSSGTREVTVLGQNVNSYRDTHNNLNFSQLLERLHAIEGLERIRFTTSHPKDCSLQLIETVAQLPKLCTHIHLPVQAGSSAILAAMNRGYSREHYLTLVDSIREHIPQVDLTTDVMVGFPGETEADFEQTLSLFEQVRYSTAFMFAFSARPGTKAATMSGQVPREVALARLASLIELQTAITRDHYQSAVGSERTVLFTMRQSKGERLWMGQDAGAYKVVCPSADDLTGALLKVRIIASSGMTLVAERID